MKKRTRNEAKHALIRMIDSLFLGSALSRCMGGAWGSMFSECVGVGGPASRCGVSALLPGDAPLLAIHDPALTPLTPLTPGVGAIDIDAVPTMRGSAAANREPL